MHSAKPGAGLLSWTRIIVHTPRGTGHSALHGIAGGDREYRKGGRAILWSWACGDRADGQCAGVRIPRGHEQLDCRGCLGSRRRFSLAAPGTILQNKLVKRATLRMGVRPALSTAGHIYLRLVLERTGELVRPAADATIEIHMRLLQCPRVAFRVYRTTRFVTLCKYRIII